ncbi:preprotein translocase subunit SecA, partial [Candidatus Uhrbacteria bacterium]|nr:preprotein translocase subunit SecA [Candidatus Uhrbacteria bacterium]
MAHFLDRFLGDPNKKILKRYAACAKDINALEASFQLLTDAQLKEKTAEFRARIEGGISLDDVLVEAFASVREASRRTLGQVHFDMQLMGAMALHERNIAEMRTGEGKTLTATLAVYLNAIMGEGVHVVTVNDYLAKRDAVWMGQIYHALGLTVGCIQHESGYVYDKTAAPVLADDTRDEAGSYKVEHAYLRRVTRKEAYDADITYGTNNEFGFDYLRDNMVAYAAQRVQRKLAYCVIDEIDSILIDEARTPLIISAPSETPSELYQRFAQIARALQEQTDYNVDEKMKVATLTDAGVEKVE